MEIKTVTDIELCPKDYKEAWKAEPGSSRAWYDPKCGYFFVFLSDCLGNPQINGGIGWHADVLYETVLQPLGIKIKKKCDQVFRLFKGTKTRKKGTCRIACVEGKDIPKKNPELKGIEIESLGHIFYATDPGDMILPKKNLSKRCPKSLRFLKTKKVDYFYFCLDQMKINYEEYE